MKIIIDLNRLIKEEINFIKEEIKYHNEQDKDLTALDIQLYINDHINMVMEDYKKDILREISPKIREKVLND